MDGLSDYIVCGMDKLMEQGSMPVTIGVFVNPGYINGPDGKAVRYNRSNEFDRADGDEPLLVSKRSVEGLLSHKRYPARTARQYDPLKAVYPGGGQAVKAEAGEKWVKSYVISPEREYLYEQDYYCLSDKPHQLVFDVLGYMYAASDRGVQVCDHNGRVRVFLSLPSGAVTSLAFAGKKLYVVSGGNVYVRNLRTGGFTGKGETPDRQGQG